MSYNIKKFFLLDFQKQTASIQSAAAPVAQQTRKPGNKGQIAIAKLFAKYDVVETSYHLHTGRIDLHLCDDMAPGEKEILSSIPWNV